MNIPSISGDDEITKMCNASFYATIKTLNLEGYLTDEQFKEIELGYVAVFVKKEGGFVKWLKAKFGTPSDMVVVMKTVI